MEIKNLTCIECPIGCELCVELDGGKVNSVTGNGCARGKMYAQNEVICPKRVLTTTVRLSDGQVVAVKTDKPIKKANQMALMALINALRVDGPLKIGDIIVKNLEDDANLIATANSD